MLHVQVIRFIFSEEYVMQLHQFNENPSLTSLLISYICCAIEPMLILSMSSNDVALGLESLSTCLTAGKNLSPSSLLPSVANPYQPVSNSSSFRSLVIFFATAPVSTYVVFVQSHRCLFNILESGSMFLNILAV